MAKRDEEKEIFKIINQNVFGDLDKILKKLNKRFNIKFYTVLYDEKDKYKYCLRLRSTFSKDININQEEVQSDDIFRELNFEKDELPEVENKGKKFIKDIKEFLDNRKYIKKESDTHVNEKLVELSTESVKEQEEVAVTNNDESDNIGSQVLYSNSLNIEINTKKYILLYIIEIRNLDQETVHLFYKNPVYSFLRMTLDYFFYDFYKVDDSGYITPDNVGCINNKYNENSTSFLRRLSRVFLGKIQSILEEGKSGVNVLNTFENTIDNKYYISNLFDEIEDISNKTYERANPFGSILFLGKDFKDDNNKKIKYAVEFIEKDRIKFSDAKRIRKLLEITNCDNELYLIADYHQILGVGELSWNDLSEEDALIRLDFKGLSKYDLIYLNTNVYNYTHGKLAIEDDKKIFKCSKNIEIVENKLLTLNFKNPKVKEEEYSPEKFKKIFQSEFGKENKDSLNNAMEKIERVVRKAKEQNHGTMVVITEPETAKRELAALRAQSTLIVPREVEPDYVKYLTSIDGAIYFDNKGNCHAIGVILDGIADEKIGDASRGSRYNSAYKYLAKLKNYKEQGNIKCVIVIISEDGMVDIIPDLENEERIQNIVQEIVYLINEEDTENDDNKLKDYESELKKYSSVIEHYLYFEIAEQFYNKKKYEKAIEYYEIGFEKADEKCNNVVIYSHFETCGLCYLNLKTEDGYEKAINFYEKVLDENKYPYNTNNILSNISKCYFELGDIYRKSNNNKCRHFYEKSIEYLNQYIKISKENNFSISSYYYNLIGICYTYIGHIEENQEKKHNYYYKAIEYYNICIDTNKNATYYRNRALRYKDLSMNKEALEDFIDSVLLHDNMGDCIENIKKILNDSIELATAANEYFAEKHKGNNDDGDDVVKELKKVLEDCIVKYNNGKNNTAKESE